MKKEKSNSVLIIALMNPVRGNHHHHRRRHERHHHHHHHPHCPSHHHQSVHHHDSKDGFSAGGSRSSRKPLNCQLCCSDQSSLWILSTSSLSPSPSSSLLSSLSSSWSSSLSSAMTKVLLITIIPVVTKLKVFIRGEAWGESLRATTKPTDALLKDEEISFMWNAIWYTEDQAGNLWLDLHLVSWFVWKATTFMQCLNSKIW